MPHFIVTEKNIVVVQEQTEIMYSHTVSRIYQAKKLYESVLPTCLTDNT